MPLIRNAHQNHQWNWNSLSAKWNSVAASSSCLKGKPSKFKTKLSKGIKCILIYTLFDFTCHQPLHFFSNFLSFFSVWFVSFVFFFFFGIFFHFFSIFFFWITPLLSRIRPSPSLHKWKTSLLFPLQHNSKLVMQFNSNILDSRVQQDGVNK